MIETKVIVPGTYVEFIVHGACHTNEIREIIINEYGKIKEGILWNFDQATRLNVINEEMSDLVDLIKKHSVHKKSAYYASQASKATFLKQYQTYISMEVTPLDIKLFRDYDEALKWLHS